MEDILDLRKFIYSVNKEEEVRLLEQIISDGLKILELKQELEVLEKNLFSDEKIKYLIMIAPFEENEDALQLALTILRGKISEIEDE